VVTASVRRQESESERLQDPNAAYLRTGFEKELMFKEGQITLTGIDQGLHIYLDQKQGITIESPSELALQADNNLTLQAGRNLVISAQGDESTIQLNHKDGKSNSLVLDADGSIGFKGKVEKESGSGETVGLKGNLTKASVLEKNVKNNSSHSSNDALEYDGKEKETKENLLTDCQKCTLYNTCKNMIIKKDVRTIICPEWNSPAFKWRYNNFLVSMDYIARRIKYDNHPRTQVNVSGDKITIIRPTNFESAARIIVKNLGVTMYGDEMTIWKTMGKDILGSYVNYSFRIMDDLAVTSGVGLDFDEISTPLGTVYPYCIALSFENCESILFTSVTVYENGIISVEGYVGSSNSAGFESFIKVTGMNELRPYGKPIRNIDKKGSSKNWYSYKYDYINLYNGGFMKIHTSLTPPNLNNSPLLISYIGFQMDI
jgi:hypothetical protein